MVKSTFTPHPHNVVHQCLGNNLVLAVALQYALTTGDTKFAVLIKIINWVIVGVLAVNALRAQSHVNNIRRYLLAPKGATMKRELEVMQELEEQHLAWSQWQTESVMDKDYRRPSLLDFFAVIMLYNTLLACALSFCHVLTFCDGAVDESFGDNSDL